jgi:hypothetical protein
VGDRSRPLRCFALGAVMTAVGYSHASDAAELAAEAPGSRPAAEFPLELGARAGFATAPIRGGVNPFGAGFGLRVGYVLSNVYFGAAATYYLGGSDVGASDRAILFGTALGYGIHLGDYVILRPLLGVGDVAVTHSEPLATVDVVTTASGSTARQNSVVTTVHNVYLAPGLTVMVAAGTRFLALNASSLVVPNITYGPSPAQSATWLAYGVEGDLGFRF